MMARVKNILIYGLVTVFLMGGCGRNQEETECAEKKDTAIEAGDSVTKEEDKIILQANEETSQKKESMAGQIEEVVTMSREIIEKAKEEASRLMESLAEQIEEAATRGSEMVEETKPKLKSLRDETSSAVRELIGKARELFDQGRFKEAIDTVQDILNNYDSVSQEARDIITRAKERLKTLVTEKDDVEYERSFDTEFKGRKSEERYWYRRSREEYVNKGLRK